VLSSSALEDIDEQGFSPQSHLITESTNKIFMAASLVLESPA
jgi:hypothetical protein